MPFFKNYRESKIENRECCSRALSRVENRKSRVAVREHYRESKSESRELLFESINRKSKVESCCSRELIESRKSKVESAVREINRKSKVESCCSRVRFLASFDSRLSTLDFVFLSTLDFVLLIFSLQFHQTRRFCDLSDCADEFVPSVLHFYEGCFSAIG